jgi:hypothetical protein
MVGYPRRRLLLKGAGMSGKLMGGVYEIELSHGQQAILLACADHGQDDGSDIFPSVDRLAWKTGYDRRNVQRIMRQLEAVGVLVQVAQATRRHPTEYRIDLSAGTAKSPFVAKGQDAARGGNSHTQGRQTEQSGAAPRPPEPSKETSVEPNSNGASSPSNEEIGEVWDHYVATMHPRRKSLDPDERKKIREALAVGTVDDWKTAITACQASDFHMKRGKHASNPRKYNQLVSILHPRKRNGQTQRSRLDMWLDEAAKQASGQTATFDVNAEADRLAAAQGL